MSRLLDIANNPETLLVLVAGSICKDFSSMGDGKRLIGKHVSFMHLPAEVLCDRISNAPDV